MQIAYTNVCGLELSTLNSLKDYLSNRQLRTKVDSKFSLKKKKNLTWGTTGFYFRSNFVQHLYV